MNIQNLPEELLVEIVHWLPLRSLATTMQVNRKFQRICRDDRLWRRHREFPYRLKSEVPREKSAVGTWIATTIKGQKQPEPRLCHTAVVYCGHMYVQGGHTTMPNSQNFDSIKSDFWKFNLITKRWEEIQQQREPKMPMRTEHSAVVWGSKMWMFGGFNGSAFMNDIMSHDLETGELTTVVAKGDIPAPRSAHVAIAFGGRMWVFGGWNGTEQNNDMFAFDFETHEWERVKANGVVPAARCSHAAALAPQLNSFFMFGGCGGRLENYLADLWQFNFETLTWTAVGRLQPGSRMKMVEYRNMLYIYGGWNSVVHFDSFYEFDIAARTWRLIENSFTDNQGKMGQFSLCLFNHKMYQFGGYNDAVKQQTNDLHVYRLGKPDFTEGAVSAR